MSSTNTDLNATQNDTKSSTSLPQGNFSTSTQDTQSTDLNQTQNDPPARDEHGNLLPLPAPPSAEEATKLDMSSGSAEIKMDHLGPLVVNADGTLSRISNWEQMTEIERTNTLRILVKRNQIRMEGLKGKEGGKEKQ